MKGGGSKVIMESEKKGLIRPRAELHQEEHELELPAFVERWDCQHGDSCKRI